MTRAEQKARTERIAAMWNGSNAADIASAVGVKRPAVYNALRRTGTLPPYGKRPARRVQKMARALPAVARDPCQRCGTRADIGCSHSPQPQHASTISVYNQTRVCSDGVSP